MKTFLLLAAALCAPTAARCADAADPKAAAAQIPHCSVLRTAPVAEPERRDWRAANTATVAAGGWRAYAKEAAREPAVPSAPCAPPTAASGGRR